jgi:hypothetical protein
MPIVNQIGNLQYVILAMFGYAMITLALLIWRMGHRLIRRRTVVSFLTPF